MSPTSRWIVATACIIVVGHSLLRLWLTSLASAVTGNIPELVGDYMYKRYQRKQAV
ncbi:MAG: hypothetical protein J07HN4v3_00445 [Halonotius sp. J07HN4]|nr:MAG: hypothetical protein J07HN4v3_00445 [Halonotius sp. J07HN4]